MSAYCLSWRGARNPSDLSQNLEAGLTSYHLSSGEVMPEKVDNNTGYQKSENLGEQVAAWLLRCSKSLDFVCSNNERSHTPLSVVQALAGPAILKVCDPYGYVLEPPLCNKIQSIETNNGKILAKTDNCCGKLSVKLNNGEELLGKWVNGGREGHGSILSPRLEKLGVKGIHGYYQEGILTGRGKLIMNDESVREGWFQHGYFHGPARGSGAVGFNAVNFIGNYYSGLPSGVVWTKMTGGGWIVGCVDDAGQYSGSQIAFLYPDHSTALFGEFHKGEMIKAKPSRLCGITFIDGVLSPSFEVISDREYSYLPSTRDELRFPLRWRDPYEEHLMEVRQSRIEGGGEGAFATRDIQPGTLVAFYNGIRMKQDEKTPYEDTGYAIWVEFQKSSQYSKKVGDHMDLPPEYHSYSTYNSTSAHKLNHSFKPNCAWTNFQHPAYGLVPSVSTIELVKVGEELTVHYMMDMENAPDWYLDAWDKHSCVYSA